MWVLVNQERHQKGLKTLLLPVANDSIDLKTELNREYICVIDSIVSSMKETFDQNDIKIVKDINGMLISCANNEVDVTTMCLICA